MTNLKFLISSERMNKNNYKMDSDNIFSLSFTGQMFGLIDYSLMSEYRLILFGGKK